MKKLAAFFIALTLFLSVALPTFGADLTITGTSVLKGTGAVLQSGTAGATITAGQVVYVDANGLYQLSKANGTAAQKAVLGIALNGASANQPVVVQTGGTITIGATVVVGTAYYLSGATAGGIAPEGDKTAGWTIFYLGTATTTGAINLNIFATTAAM